MYPEMLLWCLGAQALDLAAAFPRHHALTGLLSAALLPLLQVRKGDWITADGTTLGSDNGALGVGSSESWRPVCWQPAFPGMQPRHWYLRCYAAA